MAWIRTVPEDDADDAAGSELRELYDRGRDPHTGAVDNILSIHALHPAGLAAHLSLYEAVMRGTKGLRKVDRELIAFVVSQRNGCLY